MAQKPWIVPIPGTTKLNRLEENVATTKVIQKSRRVDLAIDATVNSQRSQFSPLLHDRSQRGK
jgi:aryl-alcohol dehydrogenase-like predicted oxidoreductase